MICHLEFAHHKYCGYCRPVRYQVSVFGRHTIRLYNYCDIIIRHHNPALQSLSTATIAAVQCRNDRSLFALPPLSLAGLSLFIYRAIKTSRHMVVYIFFLQSVHLGRFAQSLVIRPLSPHFLPRLDLSGTTQFHAWWHRHLKHRSICWVTRGISLNGYARCSTTQFLIFLSPSTYSSQSSEGE